MSDKSEAPTQSITLDYADRANLNGSLPRGRTREESRAINTLQSRLEWDGNAQLAQNQDGTVRLKPDAQDKGEIEYDLTDTEVSIVGYAFRQLEKNDNFPYSDKWLDLVDRMEGLIQNVKNRNNGDGD